MRMIKDNLSRYIGRRLDRSELKMALIFMRQKKVNMEIRISTYNKVVKGKDDILLVYVSEKVVKLIEKVCPTYNAIKKPINVIITALRSGEV